jgi:hygromycin-B 4-O-kinase
LAAIREAAEPGLLLTQRSVFRTLAGISSVDMRDTDGFGWFNAAGHGPDACCKALLCRVAEEEPGMFFGNWHRLFETTFLERDRYDGYFARMTELLDAVSVPRLLVHGGFGYGNVLVEDDAVTVVLDWQDARFGDPLFDLAYMDFWPSGHDLTELFKPYCRDSAIGLEDYAERLLACRYYVAMDSMRFFAMVGNRPAYDAVVRIMEASAG